MIVPPDHNPADTTSHSFVWHVDTIGSQGVLYDAAIISEDDIWVVGEIYLRDTQGQLDPLLYNVARWDGTQWNLERVTVSFRGNMVTPALDGIFVFSESDIWLAAGGSVIEGDGITWNLHDIRLITGFDSLSFTRAWGSSSSNIYFVGRDGSITHYDGTDWQKIVPGTHNRLWDVWGIPSSNSRAEFVVAVSSDLIADHRLLALSPTTARDTLSWTMYEAPLGVWFETPSTVYVCGNGLWKYTAIGWKNILTVNTLARVRGTAMNNIFVIGAPSYIAHYNGSNWREYPELQVPGGVWRGLAVHFTLAVAVGDAADVPIVIRGGLSSVALTGIEPVFQP